MNCSDKKTINDRVCQMPLVATDATESLVQEGRRYDFCSDGLCRGEFHRHPEDQVVVYGDEVAYSRGKASLCGLEHIQGRRT